MIVYKYFAIIDNNTTKSQQNLSKYYVKLIHENLTIYRM